MIEAAQVCRSHLPCRSPARLDASLFIAALAILSVLRKRSAFSPQSALTLQIVCVYYILLRVMQPLALCALDLQDGRTAVKGIPRVLSAEHQDALP